MPASINDKLKKYKSLFSTTLSTGIGTGTSDTITPATVTGLPTDTAITLTIDRVDASGTATPSKMERIKGVVSSGNIINYVRAVDGTTEQAHTAGAVVEMVWNADDWNDLVDWGLVEHSQLGVHDKTKVVDLTTAQTLTNKTLTSPVFNGNVDGWTSANETWAYASATTITVPSGAAAKYAKGDKIKLTQTTVKYFYVVGVADTVLTVTGGSDYTLVSATISANYYSHASSPIGFPTWFAHTPVIDSNVGSVGTYAGEIITSRFYIIGTTCYFNGSFYVTNKGSWTGNLRTTCPVAPSVANQALYGYVGNQNSTWSGGPVFYGGVRVISPCFYFVNTITGAFVQWSDLTARFDFTIAGFYEI